MVIEFEMLEYI